MSTGLFFTDSPPGASTAKDAGFGAQPGEDGRNGNGIASIEQIPGTYEVLIILDDGRRQVFPLPRGPGGLDGITPEFVAGNVVYGPNGTAPKLTPRRIALGVFALDLVLPDLTLATQAATQAAISATASADSASQSAGSASAALASAGQAAQRVVDAGAKVTLAADQVTLATGKATDAAGSATAAAGTYVAFLARYLGPKASDPTTDNAGAPLLVGALYYNTGAQPGMRVRTAAGAWDRGYTTITGGVTSFKGRIGDVSPQTGDYAVAQITGALAGPATSTDGAILLSDGADGTKAKDSGIKFGTAPGNAVRLDPTTGKLPAVDGSNVTGLATAQIGDILSTTRTLDATFLRADGAKYLKSSYPELSSVLGSIRDAVAYGNYSSGAYPTTNGLMTITFGAGLYVGTYGTQIYTSSDLSTWTARTSSQTSYNWTVSGYSSALGLFILGSQGGNIATSPDGVTWTARAYSGSATQDNMTSIAIGPTKTLIWVNNQNNVLKLLQTSDGVNWTLNTTWKGQYNVPSSTGSISYANGNFVVGFSANQMNGAAVSGNFVSYSTDAASWSFAKAGSGSAQQILGVAYAKGLYVAVAQGGYFNSSTNLAAWSDIYGANDPVYGWSVGPTKISSDGELLVALGNDYGRFFYSFDGVAWRAWGQTNGQGTYSKTIAYDGIRFVIEGGGGSNPPFIFNPFSYDPTTQFAVPKETEPVNFRVIPYIKAKAA